MKLRNVSILLFIICFDLFISFLTYGHSYEISNSIEVNLEYDDSLFKHMPFLGNVRNKIICDNYFEDTLKLNLSNTPTLLTFTGLGVVNLNISITSFNNDVLTSKFNIKVDNQNYEIIIVKNDRLLDNFIISLIYDYKYEFNDLISSIDNYFMTISCGMRSSNWYFVHPEMKFLELKINDSKPIIHFTNAKLIRKENNTSEYDISNIRPSDKIELSLINSIAYKKFIVNISNTAFYLFLQKSYKLTLEESDSNTSIIEIEDYEDIHYDSIIDAFTSYITPISNFFAFKENQSFDIIEISWRNEDQSFARAFVGTSSFITCDSKFFFNDGIAHEVIHLYFPVHPLKSDSGYFFIGESIVEVLTIYLLNIGENKVDSAFKNLYLQYELDTVKSYKSIFEIKENEPNTWSYIYNKTPYTIYEFANIVGQVKFWTVFRNYFKYCNSCVSWNDFKNFFIQSGLDSNIMLQLEESL